MEKAFLYEGEHARANNGTNLMFVDLKPIIG